MQVYFNSAIPKAQSLKLNKKTDSSLVSMPETKSFSHINFNAAVIQKTVSSQIAHEKSKLMKQIKDILATEVHILSEEEILFTRLKRFQGFLKKCMQREEEIEQEMQSLVNNPMLNSQQRLDRATKLKKEYERLKKLKFVEPPEKQPAKDNYDYALITKFKNALLDEDYDFASIQEEHYKGLADIYTIEEFKKKYPSIRIPQKPEDVIIKKIIDTLDRNFYVKLDHLCESRNSDLVTEWAFDFYVKYFEKLAPQFKNKTAEDLIEMFAQKLTREILAILERLKLRDEFNTIPQVRKNSLPIITDADREFLEIDYDSYVLSTLKKLYLNGEKLNQIEYVEGDKKISIGSIKIPEYKFEKVPEKVKKLVSDTQKAQRLQTDYQNFNSEELQARLDYYTMTEFGNIPQIYNLIVDFACCRFTQEDKQYLIKFLQTLDKLKENKITEKEALEYLKKNNIRPHGTFKLDEIDRKNVENRIKEEQKKAQALNTLREEFNASINSLYEIGLSSIGERLSKSYPETADNAVIKEAETIIKIINENLKLKNPNKIKSGILRWEIYRDYSEISQDSKEFKNAVKYGNLFEESERTQRSGQYLLNHEIVNSYPTSLKTFQYPHILQKIMEKFGFDKNFATIYLCKYEDYVMLEESEKSSILNILNIFDIKNSNDRVLLKSIIEDDYINSNTVYTSIENSQLVNTIITPKAKQEILDKHMFPGCLELFVAFEEALRLKASEVGTSGVKKTSSNNSTQTHKMELKIMGYPDRLFSSKNDYKFDIYSDKGLH